MRVLPHTTDQMLELRYQPDLNPGRMSWLTTVCALTAMLATACGDDSRDPNFAFCDEATEGLYCEKLQAPFPASFSVDGITYTYVDFLTQRDDVSIAAVAMPTELDSETVFVQSTAGHVLFGYQPLADDVTATVDGYPVGLAKFQLPAGRYPTLVNNGTMVVIQAETSAGTHVLRLHGSYTQAGVIVAPNGDALVTMPFTDFGAGNYADRYLPANIVADRYAMTVNVDWRELPLDAAPVLIANGDVSTTATTATVRYPAWYNASAIFFLAGTTRSLDERTTEYTSVDGATRTLVAYQGAFDPTTQQPFTEAVLQSRAVKLFEASEQFLQRFEPMLGAFPHERFIANGGGLRYGTNAMEYAGATSIGVSSPDTFTHEAIHSYIGRSVFPADGDSQWLDEAVDTWLQVPDGLRIQPANLTLEKHGAANYCTCNGEFGRGMFGEAYRGGVIGHLAYLLGGETPMLAFLREQHTAHRHGYWTTKSFFEDFEAFANRTDAGGYASRLAELGESLRARFADILWDAACPET